MIEQLAEFLRLRGVEFATLGVIFDIGSRDGRQAIEFSGLFPEADIVAIECNRKSLEKCRRNTHCMMFTRAWLEELHREVEAVHARLPFWKAYVQTIAPAESDQSASEQEIYFHFCLMRHASELIIRQLYWNNVASLAEVEPNWQDYLSLHIPRRAGLLDLHRPEERLFPASATSGQHPAKAPGELGSASI